MSRHAAPSRLTCACGRTQYVETYWHGRSEVAACPVCANKWIATRAISPDRENASVAREALMSLASSELREAPRVRAFLRTAEGQNVAETVRVMAEEHRNKSRRA